jgi:hypothetical protein
MFSFVRDYHFATFEFTKDLNDKKEDKTNKKPQKGKTLYAEFKIKASVFKKILCKTCNKQHKTK